MLGSYRLYLVFPSNRILHCFCLKKVTLFAKPKWKITNYLKRTYGLLIEKTVKGTAVIRTCHRRFGQTSYVEKT